MLRGRVFIVPSEQVMNILGQLDHGESAKITLDETENDVRLCEEFYRVEFDQDCVLDEFTEPSDKDGIVLVE